MQLSVTAESNMKYTICGKTYGNLQAVKREIELMKYTVQPGGELNWVNTTRVFEIFKKFGVELENGFNTIISRRRTQGGRILYAFNKLAAVEFKLSVTRDIKGCNFEVPVRYDSDGDVIMKG